MREIKFRERLTDQWDQFKKWHYWGFIDGSFISPTCTNMAYSEQFTGLHDKNGKEIYEGDVVGFYRETYRSTAQVKWDEYLLCWEFGSRGYLGNLFEEEINSLEVIGNIHSNPELLEK